GIVVGVINAPGCVSRHQFNQVGVEFIEPKSQRRCFIGRILQFTGPIGASYWAYTIKAKAENFIKITRGTEELAEENKDLTNALRTLQGLAPD
ncbi:MAG: hypothetical protein FWE40_02955, partial [Oscillospiraceae bacterium]|nr:hypothetical protein [Oscillospiraceae bacterium]